MHLLITSFISFLFLLNPIAKDEYFPTQENTECLSKSSSEWGTYGVACHKSDNSYRINLKNSCTVNIDAKVAVQEKTNRWRTFNRNNLAPGDSISGYACEGTGKYVFWTKTAGDKTVVFPTDEEIQLEFSTEKK